MNNILYVFDDGLRIKEFLSSDIKGAKVYLCPITTDESLISNTAKVIQEETESEVVCIPFVRLFHEKSFVIRDDYIKFISDFGDTGITPGRNLKEYFKYPGEDFSVWWFSSIAEKNTAKTNSYHNLVRFLAVLDIQREFSCGRIYIDIQDNALTHALEDNSSQIGFRLSDLNKYKRESFLFALLAISKGIRYILGVIKRGVFIKPRMRGLKNRKKILWDSRYLLVTYFPLVDMDALKQGKFIDKYYQPLQEALEKKYKDKFAWLGILVSGDTFSLGQSISLARNINKWGNSLYLHEEYFGVSDLIKLFVKYNVVLLRFFRIKKHIQERFIWPGSRYNLWALFKKDWYDSFTGRVSVEGIAYYLIFKKVVSCLSANTRIIYIAENHAWEKALNIAAGEKFTMVGIQHTIVSMLLLMYFSDKRELEYRGNIQSLPKPDYLTCVGNIPSKIFYDMGWSKNSVLPWGTMRVRYLKNYLANKIVWERRENKIVVALSIMQNESKALLRFAAQAFKNTPAYQIIIKSHPFLPVEMVEKWLEEIGGGDIFRIVKTPLSELLPMVKALVVNESSASLESIACQCPVIIPRLSSVADMNPLAKISDLPVYAETPTMLRQVADKIITSNASPLSYEKCINFIKEYYNFIDSNEEMLRLLEERIESDG